MARGSQRPLRASSSEESQGRKGRRKDRAQRRVTELCSIWGERGSPSTVCRDSRHTSNLGSKNEQKGSQGRACRLTSCEKGAGKEKGRKRKHEKITVILRIKGVGKPKNIRVARGPNDPKTKGGEKRPWGENRR